MVLNCGTPCVDETFELPVATKQAFGCGDNGEAEIKSLLDDDSLVVDATDAASGTAKSTKEGERIEQVDGPSDSIEEDGGRVEVSKDDDKQDVEDKQEEDDKRDEVDGSEESTQMIANINSNVSGTMSECESIRSNSSSVARSVARSVKKFKKKMAAMAGMADDESIFSSDKSAKSSKSLKSHKSAKSAKSSKSERSSKSTKSSKSARSSKSEKSSKSTKSSKSEKSGKSAMSSKSQKSLMSTKSAKMEPEEKELPVTESPDEKSVGKSVVSSADSVSASDKALGCELKSNGSTAAMSDSVDGTVEEENENPTLALVKSVSFQDPVAEEASAKEPQAAAIEPCGSSISQNLSIAHSASTEFGGSPYQELLNYRKMVAAGMEALAREEESVEEDDSCKDIDAVLASRASSEWGSVDDEESHTLPSKRRL